MGHSASAIVALLLAVLVFAAMQAFRGQLAASQLNTILGGFAGSNIFLFLLTAVSNFEMDNFGDNFQSKLIPEGAKCFGCHQEQYVLLRNATTLTILFLVMACLGVAMFASALVHRVCVTTCFVFSLGLLYCMNKISNARYAPHAAVPTISLKKKK